MCIAILNKSEKLPLSSFKESLKSNPDGFGMAWIEGGKIQTWKSLSQSAKKLYTEYCKAFERTDKPIILHFRISTCGLIDLDNSHPFYINRNLIFAHNGIIRGYGKGTENDTRHFSREILEKITEKDLFHNPAIQSLIEERIGYSKLIFLNAMGETKIYGENLGHWAKDGNWYSNDSYKPYEPMKYEWKNWKPKKWKICDGCGTSSEVLIYSADFNMSLCKDCGQWYSKPAY